MTLALLAHGKALSVSSVVNSSIVVNTILKFNEVGEGVGGVDGLH